MIQWVPEDHKPNDAAHWETIVAPIVGAGGRAVLKLHSDVHKWAVIDAYKGSKVTPVGSTGTLDSTQENVRGPVRDALIEAGKPVV